MSRYRKLHNRLADAVGLHRFFHDATLIEYIGSLKRELALCEQENSQLKVQTWSARADLDALRLEIAEQKHSETYRGSLARDALTRHLDATAEPGCSCSSGSPQNYDGPMRDCPEHGELADLDVEELPIDRWEDDGGPA